MFGTAFSSFDLHIFSIQKQFVMLVEMTKQRCA